MEISKYQYTYQQLSIALYEALQGDAFYSPLEQSIADKSFAREAMLRYMDYSMVEGIRYGEVFMPENCLHGVSIWSMPIDQSREAKKTREKKSFIASHMSKNSLETYNAIVGSMSENATTLVDKEAWYLSIVGILPEFQGKGLGMELVNRVLKKTDSLQIQTFLETFTPRNMNFYERLGFRVLDSFYEPNTGSDYWLMARDFDQKRQ